MSRPWDPMWGPLWVWLVGRGAVLPGLGSEPLGGRFTWSRENSASPSAGFLSYLWVGDDLAKIGPEVRMGYLQAIILCGRFVRVALLEDTHERVAQAEGGS